MESIFKNYIKSLFSKENESQKFLNVISNLNKKKGQKIIIYGNGYNGKTVFVKILSKIYENNIKIVFNINDIKDNDDNVIYITLEKDYENLKFENLYIFEFDKIFKNENLKEYDNIINDGKKILIN